MKPLALSLPFLLAATLVQPAMAQDAKAPPSATVPDWLKDPAAQGSYALGLNIGGQFQARGLDIADDAFMRGVRDGISRAKPAMSDEQLRLVMARVESDVLARHQAQMAAQADANKTQGAAFLKANGAKPGITTLPSGLQYEVLTAGTGVKPKLSDTIVCNYRGTLIDGTEFDSSYQRGIPATLPVSGVIRGWSEALLRMPVGSKWRLYIPADLAYGESGKGSAIAPNATLIFEVELLSVQSTD